jgi:hypothetical protein
VCNFSNSFERDRSSSGDTLILSLELSSLSLLLLLPALEIKYDMGLVSHVPLTSKSDLEQSV